MSPEFIASTQSSLELLVNQTLLTLSNFLPRLIGALLVLLVGSAIAKAFKRVLVKLLSAMKVSALVEKTPVEHFLKNADMTNKLEEVVGSVIYWLVMLIVIHTTVSILGLEPLSQVLDMLLAYIPHIFSAILVLFFGVLLAGVVESVVKGAIRSIDGKSSRLLGKVASYLVVTIAVLAAVSELGIASEFIMIIFIGFITMVSLGLGLAIGLGGQDVVRQVSTKWYRQFEREVSE